MVSDTVSAYSSKLLAKMESRLRSLIHGLTGLILGRSREKILNMLLIHMER
jgi:hypothetical protein